ncbi:MAG TPA: hypothetical protein PLP80_16045 [Niabella sp.]|nr:hypothetical protein [Niabella sp.]HRB61015.1 hypothetical protein [Niabella sp.]
MRGKKIKKPVSDKPNAADKKRMDWEHNDSIICTAFCDALMKKKKLPSTKSIAEATGLSYRTVQRHLGENSFESFRQRFRAGNEMVMINLFEQAATGKDVAVMKLWFEVTEGLGAKKSLDLTTGGQPLPAPVIQVAPDNFTFATKEEDVS